MSNLRDQLIEDAAKQLAEDIDFEVLTSMLIESGGWVKVVLNPMTWERGLEVDYWCEAQVKSKYLNRGLVWVFEDPKEANWFTLRWLE